MKVMLKKASIFKHTLNMVNLNLPVISSRLFNSTFHMQNSLMKDFCSLNQNIEPQSKKSTKGTLEGVFIGGILGQNRSSTSTSHTTDVTVPTINMENMITKNDAFEDYEIPLGYHGDYEILTKLGSGKYSQVYDAINIVKDKYVIVKVLKPVKMRKVRREVAILNLLKGHEHIVSLVDIIIDPSSKTPALVYERIDHVDFRVLYPKLTLSDIKLYIKYILQGLAFSHSQGIMHRDIKPHNIIIDPKKKILKIIDWGLAEVYSPEVDYSVRVASRYFKSPELLLENTRYDYSLDLWSLGCLLAGLIFKKEPFFHGSDNFDQLIKIVKVVGSEDILSYIEKFKLKPNKNYDGLLDK